MASVFISVLLCYVVCGWNFGVIANFLLAFLFVMPLLAIYQQLFVHFEACHFDPIDPLLCVSVCPLCHLCDMGASISFVSCGTHDAASLYAIFHVRLLNMIPRYTDTKAVFTASGLKWNKTCFFASYKCSRILPLIYFSCCFSDYQVLSVICFTWINTHFI